MSSTQDGHSFKWQEYIRVIFDSAKKPKGQLVKALERVSNTNQMLEEAKFAVFVE